MLVILMDRAINFSVLTENGAVWATPLIIDGVVYVGACDSYFYALDLHNGHPVWSYKTGGIITSGAAMHKDIFYFGCFDTYLYALSKDGNLVWKLKTNGIIAGRPAIKGNVLYFGSCDNYFYAVSLETCEVLWKFQTGDEIIGDPLIDGDRLYIGSQDSYLYCLDLEGNLIWKFRTGGSIMIGAPVAAEDTIFFASADQNFYAVGKDGSFKWGLRTGDLCFNCHIVFDNLVCMGSRDLYFYALDQKTGEIAWKFRGKDTATFTPILYKDMLILNSDTVYALKKNGARAWAYPKTASYQFTGALAESGGIAVFGISTGYIHGVNADTGQKIWRFKTRSSAALRLSGVIKPPKYDAELFDKFTAAAQEVKGDFREAYLLTTLPDTFGVAARDRKEYGMGDSPEQKQYRANEDKIYGADDPREKKKREEMIKITRTLFGG